MSLMFDKEDVAAKLIEDFEQTFYGARGKQLSGHRRGFDDLGQRFKPNRTTSLLSDEGLGSSISGSSDSGLVKSFGTALDLDKDSALGTSVGEGSTKEGLTFPNTRVVDDNNFEDDGLSVKDLILGWLARCVLMNSSNIDSLFADSDAPDSALRLPRQRGTQTNTSAISFKHSAVTQSISPQPNTSSREPRLSGVARKALAKNIFDPILREDRFKVFHPLATSLRSRSNKSIKCLRDLERSLIFEPLVSNILEIEPNTTTHIQPLQSQRFQVPERLYRTFGEFSIQLVVDTYHHLSEPEQRRAADRPYDNGYFLDLVQQVGRLAAQIGRARLALASRREAEDTEQDEMAYSPDDEITLEGGLGETGEMAELVRWKNGKGISLRTNEAYEALPGIKRQHSSESMDEDVARSMARRKKNAEPKIVELKCSDRTCDKIFNRKCDLAKHEKTHSRPFKCPVKECRYHDQGLPTEKERDRHINDKHSANPRYYHCTYCPFKTKRDSNCKQHMEKKHGWQYDRVKGNAKMVRTPGQTPQTPSMDYSPSVSSPAPSNLGWGESSTSGSVGGSTMVTPLDQPMHDFNAYSPASASTSNAPYTLFPREQPAQTFDAFNFGSMDGYSHPSQTHMHGYGYQQPPMTPTLTTSPITPAGSGAYSFGQSPYPSYNIDINIGGSSTYNSGLPTPGPQYLQPTSRNPSISYNSPLAHEPLEDFFAVPPSAPHDMQANNYSTFNPADTLPASDFALFGGTGNHTSYPSSTGDMFPNMDFPCDEEGIPDIDEYINTN
jgi:hypothetical protein